MLLVHNLIGSWSMLAFRTGLLFVVGVVLAGLLIVYATYWFIFKADKD